jgi:predicted DNA-binding antitoxin AbrB/MazE fold protein
MSQVIDAVFSDGNFKPLNGARLPLVEGQRVRLIVETPPDSDKDLVELAGRVYEGLSDEQVHEIETIAADRSKFLDNGSHS